MKTFIKPDFITKHKAFKPEQKLAKITMTRNGKAIKMEVPEDEILFTLRKYAEYKPKTI